MSKLISIAMWISALSCSVLAACSSPGKIEGKTDVQAAQTASAAGFVTVSGTAAYRQRIAMPPDAVLTVRVEDVSRADVSAPVLAQTSESFGARQVPIKFSLQVASAAINPSLSYAVRATITVGEELRFTTTRNYAVLTRGAPNNIDLVLDAVPSAVSSGEAKVMAELKNTYWKLTELDGKKISMAPTQAREVHITLASEGSRLIAFGGCNQLAGGYVQDGSKLRFTQMMGTLMACESPFMELESQVLKMLGATTSYRIESEQLTLLGGDQMLARFEAVYLK